MLNAGLADCGFVSKSRIENRSSLCLGIVGE